MFNNFLNLPVYPFSAHLCLGISLLSLSRNCKQWNTIKSSASIYLIFKSIFIFKRIFRLLHELVLKLITSAAYACFKLFQAAFTMEVNYMNPYLTSYKGISEQFHFGPYCWKYR